MEKCKTCGEEVSGSDAKSVRETMLRHTSKKHRTEKKKVQKWK